MIFHYFFYHVTREWIPKVVRRSKINGTYILVAAHIGAVESLPQYLVKIGMQETRAIKMLQCVM